MVVTSSTSMMIDVLSDGVEQTPSRCSAGSKPGSSPIALIQRAHFGHRLFVDHMSRIGSGVGQHTAQQSIGSVW
ncbi:hypothetical protein IA64_21095, partial [Xanthomonas arboricola pv. celebensis]